MSEPSIAELMSQLTEQTSRLVRDEMRLAQVELAASVKRAGVGAGLFSAAGLLAFLGTVSLVGAAVAALALVVPVWASALIIGAALLGAAGVAALVSKREVERVTPAAPQTVASVKADVREIRDAI